MNVFDCHVNRTPCSGTVEEILYKPGKFLNASFDKASEDNERYYYKIKDKDGNDIIVVQIAGLIARRIVCETNNGQSLDQGDRIGMIRLEVEQTFTMKITNLLLKLDKRRFQAKLY